MIETLELNVKSHAIWVCKNTIYFHKKKNIDYNLCFGLRTKTIFNPFLVT